MGLNPLSPPRIIIIIVDTDKTAPGEREKPRSSSTYPVKGQIGMSRDRIIILDTDKTAPGGREKPRSSSKHPVKG